MRIEKRYITDDDKEFKDYDSARKYLDNLYGDRLTRLAHNLVQLDKYKDTVNFLDKHLYKFSELIDLKRELERPIFQEDEDEE